jgi:DNA repair protein RadA/Sms
MSTIVYACRGCDRPPEPKKWKGPCERCGGWWNCVPRRVSDEGQRKFDIEDGERVALCLVSEDVDDAKRVPIGGEFAAVDAMLDGGIVTDSVTLLSGPPGIGKSTLMLQLLCELARGHKVLFVSGEESIKQVARRYNRLNLPDRKNLEIINQVELDEVIEQVEDAHAKVVVVDSAQKLQVMNDWGEEYEVGSPKAIKHAVDAISKYAQKHETAFIVIGHVTKDGAISGPRSFEHDVDCVLYFDGDESGTERELRVSGKNRNGSTGREARVRFAMTATGLVVDPEVADGP